MGMGGRGMCCLMRGLEEVMEGRDGGFELS